MRSRAEVSAEKLRGGFYTPAPLVDRCLERVIGLLAGGPPRAGGLRVLEPSAGDGAFLRGIARGPLRGVTARVLAIEPHAVEARKAARALEGLSGEVRAASAVVWAAAADEAFDAAVGNPPFVRYQFVPAADRAAALGLARRLGVALSGVSNLWIPVLLGALSRLAPGGVFAFVVPAECFTGVSAGALRGWVLRSCEDVRFDHFPPGSFPGVLQEVGVLSGRRAGVERPRARLVLVEHGAAGARPVAHAAPAAGAAWTRYLLEPPALAALEAALATAAVRPLGELARFEVATVTGANGFFCVDEATAAAQGLDAWSRPLLPRIRHAPGLVLGDDDLARARAAGAATRLLDFAADRPDPLAHGGARGYLADGAARGLPLRFKCRIREPWYRVPGIRPGALLLSKRSHEHPRVVLNAAGACTTDTIYRGEPLGPPAAAIAAAFHNSLTLLTAELEGRSFGGGVLELVPSEIARMALPVLPGAHARLGALDRIARTRPPDALVAATDALLALDADVLAELARARVLLRDRRLARNRRAAPAAGARAAA